MSVPALQQLADAAGIAGAWRDVHGREHAVAETSLRAIIAAMGFAAETDTQIVESLASLRAEQERATPAFVTADVGAPISLPGLQGRYQIRLESGDIQEGEATDHIIAGVSQPGYHRLEIAGRQITIAAAPPRAYTIEDAARGRKLWGLAVQLYAIRRQVDGGVGDFLGLADFAAAAAARGADAIAISPVHAQFSHDPSRFGPYAPSSRAALNISHIAEPSGFQGADEFVDWPRASAAKLAALKTSFDAFADRDALAAFRAEAGMGLALHTVFEAMQTTLATTGEISQDWREWPPQYRDPASAAVQAFIAAHHDEILFHTYLQVRADQDLAAAHAATRKAGMKIGIIADLAVGTDPAGSHSWSRQSEILRGLEIGAPPDAINREGQSWGITTFAPHGLRASGFSAFIEMLRHALKHAGGVRIDHIMGLSRLWVIPQGMKSAEGAYLQMPSSDLLRLVALESYRHRAVILGEDLGTLPDGFQSKLEALGIAGLRVLWFERDGTSFQPPSRWSRAAVAMTSTHDLPTVAGWWQGRDIEWRDKLGMEGDDRERRAADKQALWQAFQESGAADAGALLPDDAGLAVDAACKHLAKAASTLALYPIEDLLGSPDQPNLPGTIDEHPNWRRRLPDAATPLFERPDVATRIAAINASRQG